MKKWILFGLCTCLMFLGVAFAQETTAPVADGSTDLPSWLTMILSFDFVWKALVTGGGLLFAYLFGLLIKRMKDDEAAKEAIAAVQAGVTQTYNNFVREAKAAAADGKLTKEEKARAREMAIDSAKQLATGPALDLLKKWGKARLESLIEFIINRLKGNKAPTKE